MPFDLQSLALWVDTALRELTDPERKRVTSGYFPTSLEILGVSAPKMRKVLRALLKDLTDAAPRDVLELAWLIRDMDTHEGRHLAFELIENRLDARALLKTRDVVGLGKGNDNWASVDSFSCSVSGPVWREGQISDKRVLSWTRSPNRWWRRTAVVSTVPLNMKSRGGTGDPGRTLTICRELAGDRDPMVAKGLSWALRTLVSVDPEGVRGFLKDHQTSLPALVKREVGNKLNTGKKNPGHG
jgi:3-methyladenine DNA glycosylase AlkD